PNGGFVASGSETTRPDTIAGSWPTRRTSPTSWPATVTIAIALSRGSGGPLSLSVAAVYSPGGTFVIRKLPSGLISLEPPIMPTERRDRYTDWPDKGRPSASTAVPDTFAVCTDDNTRFRSPICWPTASVNRCASAALFVDG